jgi:hypothetical protein
MIFGHTALSRADSCQWVNVWFLQFRSWKSEVGRKKLTEHEVTAGAAPGYYKPAAPKVP